MTVAATTTEAGARPARARRQPRLPAWLGILPFLAYVGIFLLLPTGILVVDAFKNPSGTWNFGSVSTLWGPAVRGYFIGSFKLCVLSAVAGAVFGALVAYAVASGKPDGAVRRLSVAGSGVLAQFGGVTLAFAFQSLIGPAGLLFHPSWYYSFPWGIGLIYIYFQIPLMVLVFLPAIDGLKAPVAGGVGKPGLLDLAVLAARRGPAARPGVLRVGAAAVRQRPVRVRHHPGLGEPDCLHRAAADQHLAVQRGRAG